MRVEFLKPTMELTFATVDDYSRQLLKLMQDVNIGTVHLDLSAVTHCDSAGLALLIEAKRMCTQNQKGLIIQGMSQAIYALAEFCGVNALLADSYHD